MKKLLLKVGIIFLFLNNGNAGDLDLASDYQEAGKAIEEKNYTEAVKLYKNSCDKGYAKACTELANTYLVITILNSLSSDKDLSSGTKPSSIDVSKMTPKDYFNLYKKACDGNDGKGCSRLAGYYRSNAVVKQNDKKALQLEVKGCENNYPLSCNYIAEKYKSGYDLKKDLNKALMFYKKACDGQIASACFHVGLSYDTQHGTFKDNAKAISYYEKACEYNIPEPNAFLNIGVIYANGNGVERDMEKAKYYFDKACSMNVQKACEYSSKLN